MKCKICKEREATIPDRNKPGSRRKELCSECHANRLKNDFANIVKVEKRRIYQTV